MTHPPARRLTTAGARTPPALAGFFLWLALSLVGCATPQLASLTQAWPEHLPDRAEVHGVPFFPQSDFQCGPAALAMVARAAGVAVTPDDLVDQVYLPGRQGSLQPEMMAAARRRGLVAYQTAPELTALLREVAAGSPVLVFQNLGLPIYPLWHYAVVVGYDRARGELWLHSGTVERMPLSLATFERTWARGAHWAMLAVPADRLPVTATADAYAEAVAPMERVQPGAALRAYRTGIQAWPRHRNLQFGRGNAAYALGQRSEAASAYEAATQLDPAFADAWNNLAQVQWERGQVQLAAVSVGKAVALGGPRLARYLDLQRKIGEEGGQRRERGR